jgi:catechol 2,3-dioxygenase-like lactoylglutathione lyase family enzyme
LRIRITSIMVDNQEKALRFYTDVLGFQKKHDFPVGDYKWLTVVSPEGPKSWPLNQMQIRREKRSRKRCSLKVFRLLLSRLTIFGMSTRG